MFSIKEKFQNNPLLYYALSICATWAGIGSLMNGVAMTQTYGIVPSAIWVFGNTVACILFGYLAFKIPKLREVFSSKIMLWICGLMCVFQAWLSMNGMQAVFSDTILGEDSGAFIAYAEAIIFLIILFRCGMIRNVLTDGFGWLVVYLLAVIVTIAALVHSPMRQKREQIMTVLIQVRATRDLCSDMPAMRLPSLCPCLFLWHISSQSS